MSKLTDARIRAILPAERAQKVADGGGLFLHVTPTGARWWRLKYRFGGREKLLALGVYPAVSLKEARTRTLEAKALLARGIDPSAERKARSAAGNEAGGPTFETVAREWVARHAHARAASFTTATLARLERHVFPLIGKRPIAGVDAHALLEVLRGTEGRRDHRTTRSSGNHETARRVRGLCGQIMRYAVATGRALLDPTPSLKDALVPPKPGHQKALTEPDDVRRLLRAIDVYQGGLIVRSALRLAPLVFVRPGELRTAAWADIDLDSAQWKFSASKTSVPLIVPLSRQAVEILRGLHPYTGSGPYVFPSPRAAGRPMSNNALRAALVTLGFGEEMSAHGFRALARTLLDEQLGTRPDWIEHQLAHAVRDPNGRAYNRTSFLKERTQMMQDWADYLDRLREG